MANTGKNRHGQVPDAYEEANECFHLYNLGKLDIICVASKRFDPDMEKIDSEASRIARIAFERGAHRKLGKFYTGYGFKNIS
jgi:hypothetical protein